MTIKKWVYGSVIGAKGVNIRYAHFRKSTPSLHTLVFVNGRSEWSDKYKDLWPLLRINPEFDVLTWDHRGQGSSEGQRAHVQTYDHFAQDGKKVIDECIGTQGKYSILAHSMGGLISLYGTLKGTFSPQELILSSPLLMLPDSPIKRKLYLPAAKAACSLNMGHLSPGIGGHEDSYSGNDLTKSFSGFSKVQNSKFPSISPTFGWVWASNNAIQFVNSKDGLQQLSCPTLLLGGSEESVVDPMGFSQWIRKADKYAPHSVSFSNIHGAKHEILNETPRVIESAYRIIRNWYESKDITPSAFLES